MVKTPRISDIRVDQSDVLGAAQLDRTPAAEDLAARASRYQRGHDLLQNVMHVQPPSQLGQQVQQAAQGLLQSLEVGAAGGGLQANHLLATVVQMVLESEDSLTEAAPDRVLWLLGYWQARADKALECGLAACHTATHVCILLHLLGHNLAAMHAERVCPTNNPNGTQSAKAKVVEEAQRSMGICTLHQHGVRLLEKLVQTDAVKASERDELVGLLKGSGRDSRTMDALFDRMSKHVKLMYSLLRVSHTRLQSKLSEDSMLCALIARSRDVSAAANLEARALVAALNAMLLQLVHMKRLKTLPEGPVPGHMHCEQAKEVVGFCFLLAKPLCGDLLASLDSRTFSWLPAGAVERMQQGGALLEDGGALQVAGRLRAMEQRVNHLEQEAHENRALLKQLLARERAGN